jgi:antitoxin CcdA
MPRSAKAQATIRRATNVTLPVDLVAQAKALDINVSQACESGLAQSVAEAYRDRWLNENREAIDAYNERIEQEGPILHAYRRF